MSRVSRFALAVVALAATSVARADDADPLLPKETELVYFVNVKQILASDAGTKHLAPKIKEAIKNAQGEAILETLGLDPFKDIDTLTVGTGKGQADAVIIARGKFSAEKMLKGATGLAEKHADTVAVVTENDLKMIRFGNAASKMYAHVADETTVIMGTNPKLVATGVEARKTKAKPALGKEMTALVAKQDAKASLFFCQMTEGKLDGVTVPAVPGVDADKVKAGLGTMTAIAVTVRADKDIDLTVTAGMKDEDAAKGFGDTVDKLLATAKNLLPALAGTAPQSKALIDDLTKTVKHEVKKGDVIVTAKLSAEAVGAVAGDGNKKN